MKKISVLVPCFNEYDNVIPISKEIIEEFDNKLPNYNFDIIFIDNFSTDGTRDKLISLCKENKKIKAILNAKNFGQFNSPFYGMLQTDGDCTILISCDFQDPIDLIPRFVAEWEKGYKIVSGIKTSSKENGFIYFLRSCYYKMMKKLSDVEMIEQFTGFGLYDRDFIEILKELDDSIPFLRGIVAEFGYKRKELSFEQQQRRAGKTHNNWYTLYDAAMLSFTSYTKIGLRLATITGFVFSVISIIVGMIYLVLKLIYWDRYPAGSIPILLGVSFFGSVQLFFIGLLGEYVLSINKRIMHRPLVVEEERLNFEE